MKTMLLCAAMALAHFTNPNKLVGRWESQSADGSRGSVAFNADNSFEASVNGRAPISGTYTVQGDAVTINDFGCPGLAGNYKMVFLSPSDTVRFEPVADDCDARRARIEQTILIRMK